MLKDRNGNCYLEIRDGRHVILVNGTGHVKRKLAVELENDCRICSLPQPSVFPNYCNRPSYLSTLIYSLELAFGTFTWRATLSLAWFYDIFPCNQIIGLSRTMHQPPQYWSKHWSWSSICLTPTPAATCRLLFFRGQKTTSSYWPTDYLFVIILQGQNTSVNSTPIHFLTKPLCSWNKGYM